MRGRITTLINSCTDPFAEEIYYHPGCWKINLKKCSDTSESNESSTSGDIDKVFLNHVKDVIIDRNEPRTLQGLLEDYNSLLEKHNLPKIGSRSTSYLRRMMEAEFESALGFHEPFQRNQSTIVYNSLQGGCFLECAINSWGIDDNQRINSFARFLKEKLSDEIPFNWPPCSNDLETNCNPVPEIRKLLTWLRDPTKDDFKEECTDPEVSMLSDLLLAFITKKRSLYQVRMQ